ncbi:MAG TPA: peptidoglycan-binding protein [Chitinophagales bacterium]|nr:peptidoglycan-binding protein [Chitinophagales bacterium]
MTLLRLSLLAPAMCICTLLNAQIFINTGNPNLDKYKNENPNAVIWENGKNVPIPPNTPEEPEKEPVKKPVEVKKEEPKKMVETPVVKQEPVKVEPVKQTASTNTPPAGDYPPNAVPGKCYARCLAPDQYEIKEEQVIDKPSSIKIEKVPAKYETVYDTVIVKPATRKSVTIPAQYENVVEEQVVTPATQKWVKGVADKNCLSANPKDCEVWCLKAVPAVTQKVTRRVEKVAAITNEIYVPAVIKVVPRKKLVYSAYENKIETPPTYKTVMKKVLVAKGGYQEWKEVLCETQVTDSKIASIQQALKREGYDPGPVDNQMGGKTKEALVKFQQDKGLPVGNLNIETLKALGIKE